MHHANIEWLCWDWQQTHPGENPGLTGTGPSRAVIDPWSHTEPETRDITTLGYEYI
jgi:hypothetical protein